MSILNVAQSQTRPDHSVRRILLVAAIIVVLGAIAVAGEQLSMTHRADAAPNPAAAAVITSADYFPAQFPAPKGEPEPLPPQF